MARRFGTIGGPMVEDPMFWIDSRPRWLFVVMALVLGGVGFPGLEATANPGVPSVEADPVTADQSALAPRMTKMGRVEKELVHDFDGDGALDLALIVGFLEEGEHWPSGHRTRTLVVGLRDGKGFRSVQCSTDVAMCTNCGGVMGDPFMGMEVRGTRSFTVANYGGSRHRWSETHTIAWRSDGFYIVGVDTSNSDIMRPEKMKEESRNLLNGTYIRSGMAKPKSHNQKPIRLGSCADANKR